MDIAYFPYRGEDNEIQGFVVNARNITARKQAEERVRRSERRHRDYVETSQDLIWECDGEGRFTYLNPAWEKVTGYQLSEMLGRPFTDFIVGEEVEKNTAEFARHLAGGSVKGYPSTYISKEGSEIALIFNAIPRYDSNENIVGARGSAYDITERKRAEEEREKLQAQLTQGQKMEAVGRLAGGVAHDFNNMLSVILGHVEMALDQMDPAQQLFSDLQEIRKAAQRSADLTRQLLAFARRQTVAPRVLDLNETVEGMIEMLCRLIGEDIAVAWRPAKGLWPIKVDPAQIDQILANLCVNARDAIADVGKLTIETGNVVLDEAHCAEHAESAPGEYVLLAVSDDGCGMDQDTLASIFEPFFTTKEMGKGTGLGLATVYGIVKQNNGCIDVYSEPGKGTTFKIYLPRHDGEIVAPDGRNTPATCMGGDETILLVEDEPAILDVTRRLLEPLGYTVLAACVPGDATRLCKEHAGEIHLLLADVVMPEMSGRDLAGNLLSLYPDLKLLFMSGYTADVIARRGVLDEGAQFIQKPFSRQDLAAKIRQVLDHSDDRCEG